MTPEAVPDGCGKVESAESAVSSSARIRIAGIRGIQGVVRKTVNDELRATIWEPQHMDKIVPSLLYNMQKTEDADRYLRFLGFPIACCPSASQKEDMNDGCLV